MTNNPRLFTEYSIANNKRKHVFAAYKHILDAIDELDTAENRQELLNSI